MAPRRHLLATLLVSTLACGDPPPELELADAERLSHVELFGYYSSSGYLDETLPYSNMVWGPAPAAAAARAAGIRAVVDVQSVFKIAAKTRPGPEVIEAEWLKRVELLAPHLSAVAALYVSDEPYWNAFLNGVPFEEVTRRLDEAARLIRATPGFERVPLALIFADPELDWIGTGEAVNPEGYDWVGFDLYVTLPPILKLRTAFFLSLLRPEQRVIAVPEAMLITTVTDDVAALERRVEFWLSWIARDPRVIAVAPFIYGTYVSPSITIVGARELPSIRDRYAQIGRAVVEASAARAAKVSAGLAPE